MVTVVISKPCVAIDYLCLAMILSRLESSLIAVYLLGRFADHAAEDNNRCINPLKGVAQEDESE